MSALRAGIPLYPTRSGGQANVRFLPSTRQPGPSRLGGHRLRQSWATSSDQSDTAGSQADDVKDAAAGPVEETVVVAVDVTPIAEREHKGSNGSGEWGADSEEDWEAAQRKIQQQQESSSEKDSSGHSGSTWLLAVIVVLSFAGYYVMRALSGTASLRHQNWGQRIAQSPAPSATVTDRSPAAMQRSTTIKRSSEAGSSATSKPTSNVTSKASSSAAAAAAAAAATKQAPQRFAAAQQSQPPAAVADGASGQAPDDAASLKPSALPFVQPDSATLRDVTAALTDAPAAAAADVDIVPRESVEGTTPASPLDRSSAADRMPSGATLAFESNSIADRQPGPSAVDIDARPHADVVSFSGEVSDVDQQVEAANQRDSNVLPSPAAIVAATAVESATSPSSATKLFSRQGGGFLDADSVAAPVDLSSDLAVPAAVDTTVAFSPGGRPESASPSAQDFADVSFDDFFRPRALPQPSSARTSSDGGRMSAAGPMLVQLEPIAKALDLSVLETLPRDVTGSASVGGLRERAYVALRASSAASEASQRASAYSAAATSAAAKAADAAERAAAAASSVQVALETSAEDAIAVAEARIERAVELVKEAEERAAQAAALATAYQDVSQTQAHIAEQASQLPKQEPTGPLQSLQHFWRSTFPGGGGSGGGDEVDGTRDGRNNPVASTLKGWWSKLVTPPSMSS